MGWRDDLTDMLVRQRELIQVCEKCGGKMTLLFTSAVCDRCDPPKGKLPPEWWEGFSPFPVECFPWIREKSPSWHEEEARHVVLIESKVARSGHYGLGFFVKRTITSLGTYTRDVYHQLSSPCMQELLRLSWDRGNAVLQPYFYRYPSHWDRAVFLRRAK